MIPRVINFSDLSNRISENGDISGDFLRDEEVGNRLDDGNVVENDSPTLHMTNGLGPGEQSNDTEPRVEVIPFSHKTVQVAASTIGINSLSPEVCQFIATELFYKVKEVLFSSKIIVNKNKSGVLGTSDVARALRLVGGPSLAGHVFGEEESWVYVPPPADVFVEEDPEVETVTLALADHSYTNRPDAYIQGQWLLPDGYTERNEEAEIVNPNSYYSTLSKAIIEGKPAHLQAVVRDLQSNPKIGPYCPYLLNLVALTVKKVEQRDIPLTNALIATAHAIAHNTHVEPSPFLAVNRAANSLLKIVIEGETHKYYEDLALRVRAGLLLAKVFGIWSIELKQQIDIIRYLLQHLLDSSLPLQSHYGAIVTLAALGQRTLDFYSILPVVERYLPVLESRQASHRSNVMVQYVIGAILAALRITRKRGPHQGNSVQLRKLADLDRMLYDIFGDSITPVRLAGMDAPAVVQGGRRQDQARLVVRVVCKLDGRVTRCVRLGLQPPVWPTVRFALSENVHPMAARGPCRPQALYYQPSSSPQLYSYCVLRNTRFMKPLHRSSPAGDLLLNL